MRIIMFILGLALLATPAMAETDISVSVDLSDDSYTSTYVPGWYWGDPVQLQGIEYQGGNLMIGVTNQDWSARFQTGDTVYQPYAYNYRPTERFDSIITPLKPMIEPYTGRSLHPNDRGGYRVAIPRGLGGQPQLYGDYEYDQYGNPVPAGRDNFYNNHNYTNRGYTYRNRPVVIHYTYDNYPYYGNRRYPSPYYSERTYLGISTNTTDGYYQQPVDNRQDIRSDAVNVYHGDVYNYYNDASAPRDAAPVPAYSTVTQAPAPADIEPAAPSTPAYGTRFYEQTRLETAERTMLFRLDGTRLYAGPDMGPAQEICDSVDPQLGVYAAWSAADGITLLYRDGQRLVATYQVEDGQWWREPLPHAVDFKEKITLGLVGEVPWVVFSSEDGTRYVLTFSGRQWYEIGSGTSGE